MSIYIKSEIIEWEVDLKDPKMTTEQKAWVYDLIEEHCDTSLLM